MFLKRWIVLSWLMLFILQNPGQKTQHRSNDNDTYYTLAILYSGPNIQEFITWLWTFKQIFKTVKMPQFQITQSPKFVIGSWNVLNRFHSAGARLYNGREHFPGDKSLVSKPFIQVSSCSLHVPYWPRKPLHPQHPLMNTQGYKRRGFLTTGACLTTSHLTQ